MRKAYRILAFLIPIEVALQAAFHAWASSGLGLYIAGGGVADQALFESVFEEGARPFPEILGFMLHGMNGMFVIPVIAISLLIVSFFAKIPGGTKRAAIILGLVVLQITLGLFGHELSALAFLHGINAIALGVTAGMSGMKALMFERQQSARVAIA